MEEDCFGIEEIIDRLPKYFTISVASKRNSGKSYLVGKLVKELIRQKKVDVVLVMSGSAHLNKDWDFLPSNLVMDFDEEVLQNIWDKQEQSIVEKKKTKHILIIMDDCLANKDAIRSQVVNKYYSLGRHILTSFIIISQHSSVLLSPIIRGNSDIILWSKLNKYALEQLWESTNKITKKDFINISEKLGGVNYSFMLLDNYTQHSEDVGDFLSVVRA